jgi:hypothetical protein
MKGEAMGTIMDGAGERRGKSITTAQAVKATGVPETTIMGWIKIGQIKPKIVRRTGVGRSSEYNYSPGDLRRMVIIRQLRDRGLLQGSKLGRIKLSLLTHHWLLFSARCAVPKLIAVSNDRREILKAGAACAGPVVLVEMP